MGVGARMITRRAIVRGIGWSLPVVSIASVAPAFAASPLPESCSLVAKWQRRDGGYRYKVSVQCRGAVRGVTIDGTVARRISGSPFWYIMRDHKIKHHNATVVIATDRGTTINYATFTEWGE